MNFVLTIIISIAHWFPTILGYNFVFGRGKVLHFGPMGISLATGYAMFLTQVHTENFVLGILAGLCMSMLLSLFLTWLAVRLEPDALGVISIAVHMIVISVVLNWSSVTRGALGIPGLPRFPWLENMYALTAFVLFWAVAFLVLFYKIDRSFVGRQLSALAEHPWYAESLGVRKYVTYGIAMLLLGLSHVIGNILIVQYIRFLHPNDYNFPVFILLIMTIIAGKPGSIVGASIAAILITLLREGIRLLPLSADIVGPSRLILFGVILFVAVWIRRDTLFPKQRSV